MRDEYESVKGIIDETVTKPVNTETLAKIIRKILDSYKGHTDNPEQQDAAGY